MDKTNFSITVLAGLGLVGVFVLLGLGKSVDVVLPAVMLLVGGAVGVNKSAILGVFKKDK